MSGGTEKVDEVVGSARNGFTWLSRIRVMIDKTEHVRGGDSVKVNGHEFSGPLVIARKARLHGVDFGGADDECEFVTIEGKDDLNVDD